MRRVIGIISTRVVALFLSLKVSFLLTSLRVISALIGPFSKKLNKKNALSTAGVLLLGMGYDTVTKTGSLRKKFPSMLFYLLDELYYIARSF